MARNDQAAQPHARRSLFVDELRRLRTAAGLTREQLAERAGLSPKAISALERGERQQPHPRTLTALATALGLSDATRAALMATLQPPGLFPVPGAAEAAVAPTPKQPAPRTRPLPLALTPLIGRGAELAAARVKLLSPTALLARLDQMLPLLVGGARPARAPACAAGHPRLELRAA